MKLTKQKSHECVKQYDACTVFIYSSLVNTLTTVLLENMNKNDVMNRIFKNDALHIYTRHQAWTCVMLNWKKTLSESEFTNHADIDAISAIFFLNIVGFIFHLK